MQPIDRLLVYDVLRIPDLVGSHDKRGELALAARWARKGLRICQLLLGDNDFLSARFLEMVGCTEINGDDCKAAHKSFQQLVESRRIVYGERHPEFASAVEGLGVVYTELGQYDLAEAALQSCLEIRRGVFGEDSPECGTILENIAALDLKRGRFARARESLEGVLAIYGQAFPEDRRRAAYVRFDIARSWIGEEEYRKAELILREILPMFEALPDFPRRQADMLELYAVTLKSLGQTAEAESFERQAALIRARAASGRAPDLE